MPWISYWTPLTKPHNIFDNTLCLQNLQFSAFLTKFKLPEIPFFLKKIIDNFSFFITTNKNKPSRPRAQALSHIWLVIPCVFAQDHASVPLCGVAVLGLHMGYPRGYPWGYHVLEQSMPLCLPLAYPWHTNFYRIPEVKNPSTQTGLL